MCKVYASFSTPLTQSLHSFSLFVHDLMWERQGHFQGSKLCTAAPSPRPAPGCASAAGRHLLFPRARPKPPETKLVLVVLMDLSDNTYKPIPPFGGCLALYGGVIYRRTAQSPVRPMGSGFPFHLCFVLSCSSSWAGDVKAPKKQM